MWQTVVVLGVDIEGMSLGLFLVRQSEKPLRNSDTKPNASQSRTFPKVTGKSWEFGSPKPLEISICFSGIVCMYLLIISEVMDNVHIIK